MPPCLDSKTHLLLAHKTAPFGLFALDHKTHLLDPKTHLRAGSLLDSKMHLRAESLLDSKMHLLDPKAAPNGLGSLRAESLRAWSLTGLGASGRNASLPPSPCGRRTNPRATQQRTNSLPSPCGRRVGDEGCQ